ncbi:MULTISPECIES: NifB/NifX family molybdenum-iron cluster-binding protein [Lachnospiraceae]|uniref:NifB/NifX family molybdenum-iron cluster-binding protein n=1 Tax=Faecalicatena acetigenes TaxID=2981790 RepID=A0ABT2TAA6_9FIRM|nr:MULTISPECIES: NifB/NifX family molybdenum-iron cluster-binding protein [Lachnospiraceae]MCU6747218.1 NifB/NifX family molybdenum-iron cluster-binding protein [Faecalicatena acetigenes]SCH74312.1 nitrogenase cofactor biosynthesis protein NifB [uncultured Clostridium sp.]
MKIAVTYEDGQIFQHFGHCEEFKVYETEEGKVQAAQVINANGSGHGALAGFLQENGVDVLICGGIGGGARTALQEAGIQLYPGASGDADENIRAFLDGKLNFDPDTTCSHHHHAEGEACGSHHCGEDKHGCTGK